MGAYENPAANVDTESGKMWANAISSVGQNAVVAMEKVQARQAAIDKENKENAEKNNAIIEKVNDRASKLDISVFEMQGSSKDGVDYITALGPKVDEWRRLTGELDTGKSVDRLADRTAADQIYASIGVIRSGIEDVYAVGEKFKDGKGKVGEGAYDLLGSDSKMIAGLSILYGDLSGTKKLTYINGDSLNPGYTFTDEIHENPYTLSMKQLGKSLDNNGSGGVLIIPSAEKVLDSFRYNSQSGASDTNVFVYDANGKWTGLISDHYLESPSEITVKNNVSGETKAFQYKVNKKAIMEDASITSRATALVAGMTGLNEMTSFYNNWMKPMTKENKDSENNGGIQLAPIALKYNEVVTPEQKDLFTENLKKYLVNKLPSTQMSDDPQKFYKYKETDSKTVAAKKKETKFTSTLASGELKIGGMEFKKVKGVWNKVINTGRSAQGDNLTTKIDKNNPESGNINENYLRSLSGN